MTEQLKKELMKVLETALEGYIIEVEDQEEDEYWKQFSDPYQGSVDFLHDFILYYYLALDMDEEDYPETDEDDEEDWGEADDGKSIFDVDDEDGSGDDGDILNP